MVAAVVVMLLIMVMVVMMATVVAVVVLFTPMEAYVSVCYAKKVGHFWINFSQYFDRVVMICERKSHLLFLLYPFNRFHQKEWSVKSDHFCNSRLDTYKIAKMLPLFRANKHASKSVCVLPQTRKINMIFFKLDLFYCSVLVCNMNYEFV